MEFLVEMVTAVPDGTTDAEVAAIGIREAARSRELPALRGKRHLGYYATESLSDETVFKLYCNEIRNGDAR